MSRTFRIHPSRHGSSELGRSFALFVPSPDVPSQDLVICVRDRLGVPTAAGLYFTFLPQGSCCGDDDAPSVPLSSLLPDGTELRAVVTLPLQPPPSHQRLSSLGPPVSGTLGFRQLFLEPSDLPSGKEVTTDLANERTVLAWIRTGLAVIRTVFSFATLKGLTNVRLAVDVVVTIVLSISAVISLAVGWQRFAVIRAAGITSARRMSIKPLMFTFLSVTLMCCISTVLQQPKRLRLVEEVAGRQVIIETDL